MMLLGICLLSIAGQTSALDQKVSCEILRAPLRQVLAELTQKTGVPIALNVQGKDFGSTVLVKDKPLKAVLEGLASVHGLQLNTELSPIRLAVTSFQKKQELYVRAEDQLLVAQAKAKLSALAELTNTPFSGPAREVPAASDQSDRAWALRHIDRWPYYLAGMWQRLPQNRNASSLRTAKASGYYAYFNERLGVVTAFTVMPQSGQKLFGLAAIDENSRELAEHQILFVAAYITGELRVAGVYPTIVPPDPSQEFPYTYPTPPKALSSNAFVVALKEWQSEPQAFATPELEEKTARGEVADPEKWFTNRSSLAALLLSFYKLNDVSVIADAYRIASRSTFKDISGKNKGAWLQDLQRKEECFVRYANGIALVRHPGFWRLQQTEPTQQSLDYIESLAAKRPLTLVDYAQFMVANHLYMQIRFDSKDTCLFKFDSRPISKSGPALNSMGLIPAAYQQRFYRGEPYIAATPTSLGGSIVEGRSRIESAAIHGAFYGAVSKVAMRILLRDPWGDYNPHDYPYELLPPDAPRVMSVIRARLDSDLRAGEVDFGYSLRDVVTYRLDVP